MIVPLHERDSSATLFDEGDERCPLDSWTSTPSHQASRFQSIDDISYVTILRHNELTNSQTSPTIGVAGETPVGTLKTSSESLRVVTALKRADIPVNDYRIEGSRVDLEILKDIDE